MPVVGAALLMFGIGAFFTWAAFNPREAWRLRESWRYRDPAKVERSLRHGMEAVTYGLVAVLAFGFGIFFVVADATGLWESECDEIMSTLVDSDDAFEAADELGVELEDRDSIVVHTVLKDGRSLGWVNLATERYDCGG